MPKRIIKKVFLKASRTRKFTGSRHKKTGTFDKISGTIHGGGGDIFKAGAGIGVAGLGVGAGVGLARGVNPKIALKENRKDRIKKNTRGRQ